MLGVFGQVQVHALTSVGSTGRRGTVVDCYLAQHPGDGSERRSRQSPIVHLVALGLFIEHGIEGRGTLLVLGAAAGTAAEFPGARTAPRSGSAHHS